MNMVEQDQQNWLLELFGVNEETVAPDERDEPRYVISVTARMLSLHAQTLRYYERAGLVEPSRSKGNFRLYSDRDVERLRRIKGLMEELGMNLAGVEVVMRMAERMERLQQLVHQLIGEVERLRRE
jgi:MerR family transcriptional regulator/heat shock protein HspR